MWGNGKKQKTAKIDTLVGGNTEINGDVLFKGGLHVDGVIKGNVVAENDEFAILILAESGRIEGEVQVPNVSVNGTVLGDIYAMGHLELAEKARVSGSIYYTLVEMASGAEVNGQLIQKTPGQHSNYEMMLTPANDSEVVDNTVKKH